MKYHGIKLNGKHSFDDYRMLLSDFKIGIPNKKKVLANVPYSSQQFDFSTIMGFQPYERRTLTFEFNFFDENTLENLQNSRIDVINWLMSTNSDSVIEFDLIQEYYFLGEIRVGPEAETNWEQTGTLKVTIDAYPLKIAKRLEGDDEWDTFNFPQGIAQYVEFDVATTLNVRLYNIGISFVRPVIVTDRVMSITFEGVTYKLIKGTNTIDGVMFKIGTNDIKITGPGHIKFEFRREVL